MIFLQNLSTSLIFYQKSKNLEIYKHISNPFKMHSIISNSIEFCQHLSNYTSISKSIAISSRAPSISKSLEIYRILWTYLKKSNSISIFQIPSKSIKFYEHLHTFIKLCQIPLNSIDSYHFQHLSTSSELSQNLYFFKIYLIL